MLLQRRQRRPGSVLIESALVYPFLFLLMLGIVLLGVAVFRYQQVAHAAREGARWAAVHGARYSLENPSGTPGTAANVYTYGVLPAAGGLSLKSTDVAVSWNSSNEQTSSVVVADPLTGTRVATRTNTVSVTVTYSWDTGLFGTVPVSSTAIWNVCY